MLEGIRRMGMGLTIVGLIVTACGGSSTPAPTVTTAPAPTTAVTTAPSSGGAPGQLYKIAFQGALTGPVAVIGQPMENAVALAVEQGKAKGLNLDVLLGDDQVDPAQAPAVAQKVIGDGHVVGVVGPMFGSDTNAVGPLYTAANMAMLSVGSAAALSKNGWTLFRVIPNDDTQGAVAADYAAKVLNAKKFAVIDDATQYGHGLALVVASQAVKDGAAVADQDQIDPKADDFSATIGKILASGADMVFLGASFPQTAQFNRQLRDKGFKGSFFAPDGSVTPDFAKQAGTQGEGTYFTCQCAPVPAYGGPTSGPLAQFVTDYKAKFGQDPQAYSAECYDAANMVIAAIQGGATTPQAVTAWLKTANYQGVTKSYAWDSTGELKTSSVNMYQIKSGQISWLGLSTDLIK